MSGVMLRVYFHDESFYAELVATTCGIFGNVRFELRYVFSA